MTTEEQGPMTSELGELGELETELAEIFAATACEVDDFAMTRMAERAKDVPGQATGLRVWMRRLISHRLLLVAGSMSALALIAGLALWLSEPRTPTAHPESRPQPTAMIADAGAPAGAAVVELEAFDDDELALLDEDPGLSLDALHLSDDPAEAEAMLKAYDQILGGG